MKKSLLILPLAAALALSSCSKDETLDEGVVADGKDGRFLAVSIIPNLNGGGTRAAYEQDGKKFEDGTESENAVEGVRLYFFNTSGDAVSVKKNSTVNFYDIPMEDINEAGYGGPIQAETVEKTINAVVIIEAGEKLPAKIVAIVNPKKDFLGDSSISLTAMRGYTDNYAKRVNEENMKFTMFNSVYANGDETVDAVTVTPENYGSTPEEAKTKPIKIYVERNVAKVRVSAADALAKTNISSIDEKSSEPLMFPVMRKVDGKEVDYKIYKNAEDKVGTPVYVKFYGWDVTATLPYAYMMKKIKPSWATTKLGDVIWNDPNFHRSYWADLCTGGTNHTNQNQNQYFSYNSTDNFKASKFDGSEQVYCNENAEREGSHGLAATKIIIKAELCKADGTALTITEYAGNRIIDDENFTGLKARYLLMLKGNKVEMPWKAIKNDDGTTTIKELEADDIDFITATAASELDKDGSGTYYVYPCLSTSAKTYDWYARVTQNAEGKPVVEEKDKITDLKTIDNDLKNLEHAKIWNTGKTYYWADIIHLGSEKLAGVVRNHIYDINLTKIYGLGTPVYDPDEDIIPEKPQNEDTYVAAEINILSWRVVNNTTELDWND